MLIGKVKKAKSVSVFDISKWFCKDICGLRFCRYVTKVNFAGGVHIADEVVSGVDVFGTCMAYVVFETFESRLGVRFDDCRTGNWFVDGGDEVTEEFGFFCCFGKCNVLGFHGGKCDSGLFVGLP
jgi:hypothetical protein